MLEFLLENNFVKPLFYLRKDKIDTTTEISTVMSVFTHTFCPIAHNLQKLKYGESSQILRKGLPSGSDRHVNEPILSIKNLKVNTTL